MSCLNTKFGIEAFRGHQEQVISAALNGRDCLVVMPTGKGKSLCYQLPAALSDGLTVVISPLKSLMNEQSLKMMNIGVSMFMI
jgi:ATP-dependent DNA helicase RecQ